MDITIIFERDLPYGARYRVNTDDKEITFTDIIREFIQMAQNYNHPLNFTGRRYYALDVSNSFTEPKYIEITNPDTKVWDIPFTDFDLYISNHPPSFPCPTEFCVNSTTTFLEEDPLDSMIHEGLILVESKDYHNSVKIFQEAREEYPNDPRPIIHLVEILLLVHKYKPALTFVSANILKFPNNTRMKILNAKTHYKNCLYTEALEILKSIQDPMITNDIDQQDIYYLKAKTLIKLECYSEADALIKLLKGQLKPNLKIVKLIALFYFVRGNILESIKTMVNSCVHNPNYLDLQKYIGKYITSYKSANILLNELYDGIQDANQMFFLGKTYYDYGRCDQADSYLVKAFMLNTKSAAISLIYIKNQIAQVFDPMSVLKVINTFLYISRPLPSFLLCDTYCSLDGLLQLPLCADFNQFVKKSPPMELKLLEYGKIVSPYSTAELETIEIIMTYQLYLFQNGMITQSKQLVRPKLFQYALNKTIISDTAKAAWILWAFSPTIQLPLPLYKPIYVIGYETVIPIAFRIIDFRGEKRILRPILIQGLSYTTLAKRTNAPYFEFQRHLNLIPEYSTVIFDIGKIDCKYYIKEALKMIHFASTKEAMMTPIELFIDAIKQLRADRNIRILVHPVMPTNNRHSQHFIQFNQLLKAAIEELETTINEVQFLDFVDEMLEGENKAVNGEFIYNNTTWNHKYLPLMENYINTHLPLNPFPDSNPSDPIDPDFD